MEMRRFIGVWQIIGFVIIAIGVAFILRYYRASGTFGENVKEQFTGRYTETTENEYIWGIALIVLGSAVVIYRVIKK